MAEEKIRKLEARITLLKERREVAEATLARSVRRAEDRLAAARRRLEELRTDLDTARAALAAARG